MKNRKVERNRKPVLGLQPKYMYALVWTLLIIFGLVIRHVLLIIGLLFIVVGICGVWLTIGRDYLPNKQVTNPLERAVNNIHTFYYEQGLIIDDASNLNYYLSPVTSIKRGLSLEAYCIPAKRDEMLAEQTLDALQAYLDHNNCGLLVKRSYYDHGYIIYDLSRDLDSDRLDF